MNDFMQLFLYGFYLQNEYVKEVEFAKPFLFELLSFSFDNTS